MGNSAVGILVAIVVVVLVIYLAIVTYQHYIIKQMRVLQAKFEQVQSIPIQDELDDAQKMNLSGETLDQLNGYTDGYQEILDTDFTEINDLINGATKVSKTLNFLRTNKLYHAVNQSLGDVTQRVQMIQAGLVQIKDLNKQHHKVIQDLTERFKQMHTTLLNKNYLYGPTTDNLEVRLTKAEEKFAQFKQLTEDGDHDAAENILPELVSQSDQLQVFLDEIPKIYKSLTVEYPEQVDEIKTGHREMVNAGYQFADDNIDGAIQFVGQQIEKNLDNLRDLEIAQTRSGNHQIDKMIDQLYDAMELEIKSKRRVQKQIDVITAFVSHAQRQNIELMSELKQLDKNYDLEHQEIETTRELAEQIKAIDITHQNDLQSVSDGRAVYSRISEHISEAKKALSQIEAQQREINASVANLNEEEDRAVKAIQDFELQMHTMKRRIENMNLPGISDDYIDAYSLVDQEVQKLSQAINQTRISMDSINEQIEVIKSDVDNLLERTNTLLDSAALSEQMMQFANRYRTSHADIAEASKRAHYLFDHDYQYEESLNVIVTALDLIDPAIYQRIQSAYYRHHKN
ncbi:septation ring formation regulator EzrA [Nicoliella spurrieriana]|uniref:Septation ring formation regulator EzrA n=1 Tax=Nicoliella spurrieriana TaxID=2925830 RepID=A0A976RS89_9LACO|nr:septation ring formation regulator EzrA [Nicoliella spurrieriana]UQS86815.1 septation ring formation regulator EzrA [Nicoliella spurrieriana]